MFMNSKLASNRMSQPHRRRRASLAVSVFAILFATGAAAAQTGETIKLKPPQRIGKSAPAVHAKSGVKPGAPPWSSRCVSSARNTASDCSVEQRVLLQQNGQLLAAVTVSLSHDANVPTILVQVPLGLALSKGVTLKLDNRGPVTLPLQTCEQTGCYAATKMSNDFLEGMKTGKTMELQFFGNNNNPFKVPMPLEGFADMYARINK
jgi:invasion protein IalB